MKTKQKTPRSKKKIVIAVIFIALLIGGIVGWFYYSHTTSNNKQQTPPSTQNNPTVDTYKTQSEGKSVDVPTNVDPSSIKNYELITENEDFKIRKINNQYVITLYPIINHPDEESYTNQLKQFKQEALNYLTKSGLDVKTLNITYDPTEAANL